MDASYDVKSKLIVPFAMEIIIVAAWGSGLSEITKFSRIRYQNSRVGRPFTRMSFE
jgi:hypothetical protein